MPTVANSLTISGSLGWKQQSTNSGFNSTIQGPETKTFSATPSANTYTEVSFGQVPLAAGADTTINFYQFTNALGAAVTCTKILGLLIKATGNGGQLRIEQGDTNPISWLLGGTDPTLTLTCGAGGCGILIQDGAPGTLSNTAKTLKVSNPGASSITVEFVGLVGT